MAYHGVLIPEQIAAANIDSYNRSVWHVSASSIDNGMIFNCTTKVWTTGSGAEVFNIIVPTTGSLNRVWMAYSGDEIVVTDAKYKGLDPNPRNFYNAAGKVFSAYKPEVGDIILLTAEAMTGTVESAFANAVNGAWQLTWAAASITIGLSYKYLQTKYISLATGGIDSQRVAAYQLECVNTSYLP
jgi:hypothetical protein